MFCNVRGRVLVRGRVCGLVCDRVRVLVRGRVRVLHDILVSVLQLHAAGAQEYI